MNYFLSSFFYVIYSYMQGYLFSFCFLSIIKYIANVARAIKKMTFNKIRDFIFENYYRRTGFSKENSYY